MIIISLSIIEKLRFILERSFYFEWLAARPEWSSFCEAKRNKKAGTEDG